MKILSKVKDYLNNKDEYSNYLKERNSLIKENGNVLRTLTEVPLRDDKVVVIFDTFDDLLKEARLSKHHIYYKMEDKSCVFIINLDQEILLYTFKMNDGVICETERMICRASGKVLGNVSEAINDGTVDELEDTLIFRIDENGLHLDEKASVSENVDLLLHNEDDFSESMYIKRLKKKIDSEQNKADEKDFEHFDIRLVGYANIGNSKKDLSQCSLAELLKKFFGISIFVKDSVSHNITLNVIENIIVPNLKKEMPFLKDIISQNDGMEENDLLLLDFDHLDKLIDIIHDEPWSKYGKKYLSVPGKIIDLYNEDPQKRKKVYEGLLGVPEQLNFFRLGAKDDFGKEATWYSTLAFERIVLKNSGSTTISDCSYYLGRTGTKVQRMLWSLSKYLFFDLKDKKSLSMFLNENLIDKFYTPFAENKNVFNYLYDYLKYVYFYAETMCHLNVLYDSKGEVKKWSTSSYMLDEGYVEVDVFSKELLNSMRGKILNSYLCVTTDDEFLSYRKYLRKSLADLYIEYLKKNRKDQKYNHFYDYVHDKYPQYEELLKR